MRYSRILVKLSGGAIAGEKEWGFDPNALNHIADEVLSLHQLGVQVSVVVGGGNIFRGERNSVFVDIGRFGKEKI